MKTMLQSKKKKWLWILAWVVASFLIYLCVREIHWGQALEEFKKLSPFWIGIAVIFDLAILVFWALQWIAFLPKGYNVKFLRMIEINALMSMTANTVPFLAGHALGVILLSKREKVGNSVALSVMALDQLAEGFAKITLFLFVALLTPLPEWMKKGILMAILGIFLLSAFLFICAHRYRHLKILFRNRTHPNWKKFRDFIYRWGHHLEALRSFKIFAFGMLMALSMKGAELMLVFSVQKSFGLDLPVWTVFLVMASVSLATMVPISPGNLGVYEATVFFIYKYVGLSPEQALGLALVQHISYLVPKIVTGYLILFFRNFYPEQIQKPQMGVSSAE